MGILNKVSRHVDEASYLYGFSHSLRERLTVTWFLLKKKGAQLGNRLGSHNSFSEDALLPLYGARHVVDLAGTEIFVLDEIYREHLYDRVAGFVPKAAGTVVDVGANVGMFAVQQAHRGAHVYAFEPNRDCYRRLSKAVVENGLTEAISIFNYAIGRTTGIGAMHVPDNRTVYGSVIPVEAATSSHSAVVRITSLDQILPALGVEHVDLLKIDTEGAEVDVLRGAVQTLRNTERIIVEYHNRDLQHQVGTFFNSHGFRQVLDIDTSALPDSGLIYAEKSASDGQN
jgi:FkbM family methyltransferase